MGERFRTALDKILPPAAFLLRQRKISDIARSLLEKERVEWGPEVAHVIVSRDISSFDKEGILKKTFGINFDAVSKAARRYTIYGADMRLLLRYMPAFEWSDSVRDFCLSYADSNTKEAILEKLESVRLKDVLSLKKNELSHSIISQLVTRKVEDCTWADREKFGSGVVADHAYFGPASVGLEPHAFFETVRTFAQQSENQLKTYPEALESITRPVFDKTISELKGEGVLLPPSPEHISEGTARAKAMNLDMLSHNERASLETLGVDWSENKLNVYLRYGNTVNYGPVADSLLLCTAWFFEARFSRFFDGVRILRHRHGLLPSTKLVDYAPGTEFVDVMETDFRALVKLPTAYFSHSANESMTPSIISAGMRKNDTSVMSKIELQKHGGGQSDFARDSSLEQIVDEHIRSLIKMEEALDLFLTERDLQFCAGMAS